MLKWICLFIYLASIITVIFVERKRPTEALLWVFIMICLPYFGTLLYLIFGNTTLIQWMSQSRKKRLNKIRKAPFVETEISSEDAEVIHFNYVYNQSVLTEYDSIQVFTSGVEHYQALFDDIAKAKHTIYIEFYTIHHDEVGQAFVNALTSKAKQGVTVYVLCDFIANLSTPPSMFQPLKDAGGQVIRVKPYLTHYRSHRKIVVIDDLISYIGGMNIGKQYANRAKKKNPWRDSQVRMQGECSKILCEYFLEDWLCANKKEKSNEILNQIEKINYADCLHSNQLCQFIMGGVDTNKEKVKMVYLSMIRSAKQRIRIQSPYFIPDASILDALKTAAATGIDIEIMIPGIKASFFLDPTTNYYCGELLKYGAKIYKYNGYIHAKTLTIDDEICAIGSVNMDMRSLMVDDEICGIYYDNSFVALYNSIYDEDLLHCKEYTFDEFKNRSQKEKILEGFFLLFAPLM